MKIYARPENMNANAIFDKYVHGTRTQQKWCRLMASGLNADIVIFYYVYDVFVICTCTHDAKKKSSLICSSYRV